MAIAQSPRLVCANVEVLIDRNSLAGEKNSKFWSSHRSIFGAIKKASENKS